MCLKSLPAVNGVLRECSSSHQKWRSREGEEVVHLCKQRFWFDSSLPVSQSSCNELRAKVALICIADLPAECQGLNHFPHLKHQQELVLLLL